MAARFSQAGSGFLFRNSPLSIGLLAESIQGQHLFVCVCAGNGADGQDHIERTGSVSVCRYVRVDVVIGERPCPTLGNRLFEGIIR